MPIYGIIAVKYVLTPGDLDLWPTDMKMYTAHPLVMIYLPTKFEGDRLKNKGDIAEPIQAVKKEKEKE